jgi:hypothetical protein
MDDTTRRSARDRYDAYWRSQYMNEPYYDPKYMWDDFDPAYRYAFDKHAEYPDQDFNDIEDKLAAGWNAARGKSRLAWDEAKRAVRSGWHAIERALPGDADDDGR